jgi:hypothetical protein
MSKDKPMQTGKRPPTRVGGSLIRSRSNSEESVAKVRTMGKRSDEHTR